ncbi:MAG TPA: prephenate dehydrogenase/arogenate dehydrogenase family protein [Pyrinomonadaceae bacterium]
MTIVGCGLIGSSFALAMKSADSGVRLAGWDESPSVLDEARRRNIIDEVDSSFAEGRVSSSDLVYLAMPVREIISFLRERGGQVKPGAVITDAGSTKEKVCDAARERLPKDRRFVGGHPIAGSHLRGPAHARAELFREAAYVLTTDEGSTDRQALKAIRETLHLLGARVTLMTAREHDRAMALVSHLPQLVSSALASLIRDEHDADALMSLAGAGYRDWARLSGSSWGVWRDILATNPAQIASALDGLTERLAAVSRELRADAARDGDDLSATRAMFKEL